MFPERGRHSYRFDDFTLDPARRLLLRANQPVPLNPKAFELLAVLVENRGRVITKEELLEQVWPNQFVEEGNLTVHMSAVRKALGERKAEPRYVVTIPGRGYQFIPEVAEEDAGLVIEQHMLSRVVVEGDGNESDELVNEAIERVATENGLPTARLWNHAGQAVVAIGSREAPDRKTATRVLAQMGSLRITVRVAAGLLLGLVGASALAYLLFGHGQNRQRAAGLSGGLRRMTTRQLTAVGNVGAVTLSPDGKYYVYNMCKNGTQGLWFGHVNGGSQVELHSLQNGVYGCIRFAPDGGSVLYQLNGALFQIPVLGGASQKLLDRVPGAFAISRDGSRVAFARSDRDRKVSSIIIANLDGSGERELVTLPAGAGFSRYGPAWSPDGQMLAIGAASQTNPNQDVLVGVRVADGKIQQLNPKAWDQISTVAWTGDGAGIVFHGRGPESDYHLWLLDYPQGELRCITPEASRYGRDTVSLAEDGNSLVAVRGAENCSVWVGTADDIKQSRQITSASFGKEDGAFGLAWTPEGKIVYVSSFNNSDSLWVMNADGSDAKQITPSGFIDQFPRVTRDGRYIVFESNRGGSSEIWRVNPDGSDMRRLTSGGNNANADVTPDGRWVLYASSAEGTSTIWKVSIDGGEPSQVIATSSDCPRVSPDGRLLACAYYDRSLSPHSQLAILSLNDFGLLYHFDLARSGTFNNGVRWSPDGSAVVYRNFSGGLWRQSLTGGPPEKPSGAPDKRIYYFDWSTDGKQFAMTYGDAIRDIVLITNFR